MHVQTRTTLAPGEVEKKLRASEREGTLQWSLERKPPKVFLATPLPVAPAAELRIARDASGSEVILRLMWGPLPAPFPRALALAGLLLALVLTVWLPLS